MTTSTLDHVPAPRRRAATAPSGRRPRSPRSAVRFDAARPTGAVPVLTADGRRRLNERADRLRDEVLPELRPLLVEWQRDERLVAEFERAQHELDALEGLLAEAMDLPPVAADVFEVGLGARVEIEMPDGERSWVRLVHPAEAYLDDERISVDSPLARALLGAGLGHTVWVPAPTGSWPCRVAQVEYEHEA